MQLFECSKISFWNANCANRVQRILLLSEYSELRGSSTANYANRVQRIARISELTLTWLVLSTASFLILSYNESLYKLSYGPQLRLIS
jgi:hypothetical protein